MSPASLLFAALASLLLSLFSAAQTESAIAAGELQLGVNAYKMDHYEDAVQHFEKAVDLDGGNLKARLYLATACTALYIPGVDTPENMQWGEKAIAQYQQVIDADAEQTSKINSAKAIGSLYQNMKKFDDSRKYYLMASDLDPKDPEPYYSVGVIDWTACYQPRMEERARLGLKPEQHLNAESPEQWKVCDDLKATNKASIEEGIDSLNKAIQLRPDYDDAMAYLNLMYREQADLDCEDPAARAEDLRTADHWVDETLRVKKQKAEKRKVFEKPRAPSPQ